MADNTRIPVSVANVKALDDKRRAEYAAKIEIDGTTVNLKNAAGGTIATATTQDTTYTEATQGASGLMSAADKTKLDGIESGANNYTLPVANGATLGGVKVGSGVDVTDDGTISVKAYELPAATENALGGVKAKAGTQGDGVGLEIDSTTQKAYIPVATTAANGAMSMADKVKLDGVEEGANKYVLPQATDSVLGGVTLVSALDSDSTTAALTAAAGKALKDAADSMGKTLELDPDGVTLRLKDAKGQEISNATIHAKYELPVASATTLGGVKQGTGVSIAPDGTLSVTIEGGIRFVGIVADEGSLPSVDNKNGDIVMVGSAAPYKEFIWNGTAWEIFGMFEDTFDPGQIVMKTDFMDDEDFLALMA